MSRRQQWIAWALLTAAAVFSAISAGRPIVIPPLPITSPKPEPGTEPKPEPAPEPKADPLNAIVRISREGVGCSATITGPRRVDGRYDVLTAAHCCQKVGERWLARFRDGRTTGIVIVAINREADFAWGLTDNDTAIYPFAILAERDPEPGASIWHAGYGVDRPGNREEGTVTSGRNREGQIEYRLSVSSGDSGGGIVLNDRGELLSPVCCTTAPGKIARVWGASPVVARAGKVIPTNTDEWNPIPIPVVPEKKAPGDAP